MLVNSVYNFKDIQKNQIGIGKQVSNPISSRVETSQNKQVSFNGLFSDLFIKKFSTPEENKMYNELSSVLSGKDQTNFDILYKTGRLSNRNSNDNSSTLENLYKIYSNPRIVGLDNKRVLSETIERLANPFSINQKFGQIPDNVGVEVLKDKGNNTSVLNSHPYEPKSLNDMNVKNSASCVAASIEFSLADKKPAEFARMVEGLSGPKMSVDKKVKLSCLNKNIMDALYLLKMFNVTPEKSTWDDVVIKIAPDRDAIVRARVQGSYADTSKARSSVDVLLQSAFMQLGSQSTYNSLTDRRYGSLNANDTGLTEFEKTFVESIVGNDGEKTSMVYQRVNDDAVLEGYFHPPEVVQQHLLTTLAQDKNVIVGITETDENNKIIGGHEITIIDYKMKDNQLYFVCNDTDDDYVGAIEINANALIPKIHHAGIPKNILDDVPEEDRGKKLLQQYSSGNMDFSAV